jgi:hypothetical protein
MAGIFFQPFAGLIKGVPRTGRHQLAGCAQDQFDPQFFFQMLQVVSDNRDRKA